MKTITLNKSFDDLSPIANTKRNKTLLSARNEHSKNLLIGDDDISLMKLKILIQSNIQSIVGDRTSNENVHVDLGTPIQKKKQKIEDLQSENFKIKQQIINQINQNNLLSQQIKQKKNEIAIIAKESDEKGSKLQKEKQTLLNNIQTFANELDEQSEKNKKFHILLSKNNGDDYKTYNNAIREIKKLKEDNVLLKKILEIQNHKNNINYYYSAQQNKNNYKTRNNYTSRRLGNYTIEQEEDFKHSEDFIFFTCGGGKK